MVWRPLAVFMVRAEARDFFEGSLDRVDGGGGLEGAVPFRVRRAPPERVRVAGAMEVKKRDCLDDSPNEIVGEEGK